MIRALRLVRSSRLGLAVALLLLPTVVLAAGRLTKQSKLNRPDADRETVEMFAAIDSGQIDVRLIPKDSTQSRVMIENKTNRPLSVKLPKAFAGVPVLAQALGGNNRNNNGGGAQGFGGGFGGGLGGGGGGFMNVAPEKVGKFAVTTVCLEHGKSEPRAAIPYKIQPIQSFTDKPEVAELCRMLGTGRIDQRSAQAAAWHLNNNMSWQELAAKRLKFANGSSRPYFSPQQLRAGMQLSVMAAKLVQQRDTNAQSSESVSLN